MSAANPPSPLWLTIFTLVLSGPVAKLAYDAWKTWRTGPTHTLRKQADVDASIATVARARDELEADNARLRNVIDEERIRHEADRQRWLADQERYRRDIERLEAQIIRERDAAAARYDSLLDQVQHLRRASTETKEQP